MTSMKARMLRNIGKIAFGLLCLLAEMSEIDKTGGSSSPVLVANV